MENPMQPSFLGHPPPPPLWNTMGNLFTYSLRGNKVGDTGVQALAEGLQHCTNLQNLEWVICLYEHQVYVKPVRILGFTERLSSSYFYYFKWADGHCSLLIGHYYYFPSFVANTKILYTFTWQWFFKIVYGWIMIICESTLCDHRYYILRSV